MAHSPSKLLLMQWIVIGVLVLGGGAAFFLLMTKTDQYKDEADSQRGNMQSLREQVRQLRNPTPTPGAPLPEATTNGPSPSVTPRP
jgi:hypothetical protein